MHLSAVVLSQEHNAKNYASKKALRKSKMSSGWTLYTDFPRGLLQSVEKQFQHSRFHCDIIAEDFSIFVQFIIC